MRKTSFQFGYKVRGRFKVEYWSDAILDFGLRIVEFYFEVDLILIAPIRNLHSKIRNSLTPILRDRART